MAETSTSADKVELYEAQIDRLNDLMPAGRRHDQENMARIDQ
jgi:hypothetical protein